MQDIFLTETAEFADVILPASSFLEKDGTYTNTDRRVQIGRKALEPPGDARRRLAGDPGDLAAASATRWTTSRPREVFDEFASLMPSYAA